MTIPSFNFKNINTSNLNDVIVEVDCNNESNGRHFIVKNGETEGSAVFFDVYFKARKLTRTALKKDSTEDPKKLQQDLQALKSFIGRLKTAEGLGIEHYNSKGCWYQFATAFHRFFGKTPMFGSHMSRLEHLETKIQHKLDTLASLATPEVDIVPQTEITDPLPTESAYKGSNAEYLVLKNDGQPCSLDEFTQVATPITDQRFPRPKELIVEESFLENESAAIESQLINSGFTPVKIPKSLYDLFYLRFHLEDRVQAVNKREDKDKIKETALNKYNEGRSDDPKPSVRKKQRLFAYNPDGELSIHVPKVNFRLREKPDRVFNAVINKRYAKHEAHENYPKVLHQLNERTLNYIKELGMDPRNLGWDQMRQVAESLLADVNTLRKQPSLFDSKIDDGKILDFFKRYETNQERADQFILGAIQHEYEAPPWVYTIYRGADADKDDLVAEAPYSFSFGHSALAGFQFDGHTGSPISFAHNSNDLVAMDIDIREYEAKGDTFEFIHIPGARGPNRLTEWGEVGHVRSKVKHNQESGLDILGFTAGGALGVKKERLEHLVSHVTNLEEVQAHNKASRVFFKTIRTVIVPKS